MRRNIKGEKRVVLEVDSCALSPTSQYLGEVWALLYTHLSSDIEHYDDIVTGAWLEILRDFHVVRLHKPLDEFSANARTQRELCNSIILKGAYHHVFGLLQYFLRHPECPFDLPRQVERVLLACRAGYRLLDGKTFIPIASEEDAKVAARAFETLSSSDVYKGARTHLTAAAERLTEGDWRGSIRESIHAVESVVCVLTGKEEFGKAIAVLEARWSIHGALKRSFLSLYGYKSDQPGIRHPVLDDPKASADEVDALFMFGACSSFVSYLIGKERQSGQARAPLPRNSGRGRTCGP
jgi:hypothetical protein